MSDVILKRNPMQESKFQNAMQLQHWQLRCIKAQLGQARLVLYWQPTSWQTLWLILTALFLLKFCLTKFKRELIYKRNHFKLKYWPAGRSGSFCCCELAYRGWHDLTLYDVTALLYCFPMFPPVRVHRKARNIKRVTKTLRSRFSGRLIKCLWCFASVFFFSMSTWHFQISEIAQISDSCVTPGPGCNNQVNAVPEKFFFSCMFL